MLEDDVERRLEALGGRRAPAPRPAFVDALGDRLFTTPARRSRRPQLGRVLPPLASAAAAAIVTLMLVGGQSHGRDTVRMFQAAGAVEVVLPDGSVVPGTAGMTVPDGSVVRVRGQGSAQVGDVLLGPDEVGTVEGGTVQPSSIPSPSTTAVPRSTTTSPPTTAAPRSSAAASPTTTTTTTTSTPASTSTTTTTVRPQPDQMTIAVRYDARGEVVIRWSGYGGDDFGSYVVLRSAAPQRPMAPGRDGTELVFSTTDQRTLFGVDHPPAGMRPVYRVVALDDARPRRVVAQTFAATPRQAAPTAAAAQTSTSAPAPAPTPSPTDAPPPSP